MAQFFSSNPLIPSKHEKLNLSSLLSLLVAKNYNVSEYGLVLPFYEGRPLVFSRLNDQSRIKWGLGWQTFESVGLPHPSNVLPLFDQKISQLPHFHGYENLMYLGDLLGIPRFAFDFTSIFSDSKSKRETSNSNASVSLSYSSEGSEIENLFVIPTFISEIINNPSSSSSSSSFNPFTFIDLRTIMVATDSFSNSAMQNLAISGQGRALLEWHKQVRYCGKCGSKTSSIDMGSRRLCQNSSCSFKLYPRLDPVVIMLVIDKERDRVALGRQARFQPGMWSCIAGFIEAGETLEEAVKRETREEIGLEIDQIVYQTSQPWPVGMGNVSCQIMIGFFAYAKSFDIKVDKKELQDAKWFTRHEINQALLSPKYKQDQAHSLNKLHSLCHSNESHNVESNKNSIVELYVPGPYAIAHHLIKSWSGDFDLISRV